MTPPPQPLRPEFDLADFTCGRPPFDDWLRRRAWQSQASGAWRGFVVCDGLRVVAYYSLANGALYPGQGSAPRPGQAPGVIPVMVLGRLAVDQDRQGQGMAAGLLKDAILRTLRVAELADTKAILALAPDQQAAGFYRSRGFLDSPIDPLVLLLPLDMVRRVLGG